MILQDQMLTMLALGTSMPSPTFRPDPHALQVCRSMTRTNIVKQRFLGYVVTGGQDTVVNVFALGSPLEPEYSLLGHRENVCSLDATEDGTIISGSWDRSVRAYTVSVQSLISYTIRSARVWRNFTLDYELVGHEQAVWAVLAVGKDAFLTGKLTTDGMSNY